MAATVATSVTGVARSVFTALTTLPGAGMINDERRPVRRRRCRLVNEVEHIRASAGQRNKPRAIAVLSHSSRRVTRKDTAGCSKFENGAIAWA